MTSLSPGVRDVPGLLTVAQVAALLGIRPRTVYNLAGLIRTELPARGHRRIVRYHPDDVERYRMACRRTGEESAA